jgi:hypothetical protein
LLLLGSVGLLSIRARPVRSFSLSTSARTVPRTSGVNFVQCSPHPPHRLPQPLSYSSPSSPSSGDAGGPVGAGSAGAEAGDSPGAETAGLGKDAGRSASIGDPADEGDEEEDSDGAGDGAVTRTVNQRLLDELREAAEETEAPRSSSARGRKNKKSREDSSVLLWGGRRKTDEERQRAIDEARDLNGVDPLSTLAGSLFALGVAGALWALTSSVAEFFASHPPQPTDLYVVQRATAVFRNVVIGMFALASGFFGVTGVGILLLAARVAVGVAKGDLDPKSGASSSPPRGAGGGVSGGADEKDERTRLVSSAWELMTGGGDPAAARRRRRRLENQEKDDGDA